ncbi:hypothetical protein GCM10027022_04910 [Alpinimonas psychrophila]
MPGNWWTIVSLLKRSDLIGVIVKLTASDFERIHKERYSAVAAVLFEKLARKPYLIVVHEAVVGDSDLELTTSSEEQNEGWDGFTWNGQVAKEYFGTLDNQIREHVLGLLAKRGLTISTYKRNAEASVLATSFVEDTQSNLLFRIYVPSGRLYEEELAKLLSMFHDWLGSVKHQTVRQGGYKTPSGRVIEFYGEPGMTTESVGTELEEFAQFLGLLYQPGAAEAMLQGLGLERMKAVDLVARYGKEARRVLLDTKHERDRRMLAIKQQLESELVDDLDSVTSKDIESLVQLLVPASPFASSTMTLQLATGVGTLPSVTIQQQIFQHVEGVVAQNVNGAVALGAPAEQLIELVRELGAEARASLETDARELSDPGAPSSARIGARQRLKAFLVRNGQRIESATFQMMWKWIESQIGGSAS